MAHDLTPEEYAILEPADELPEGYGVVGNSFGASWRVSHPTPDGSLVGGRCFDSRDLAVAGAWAAARRVAILKARAGA